MRQILLLSSAITCCPVLRRFDHLGLAGAVVRHDYRLSPLLTVRGLVAPTSLDLLGIALVVASRFQLSGSAGSV